MAFHIALSYRKKGVCLCDAHMKLVIITCSVGSNLTGIFLIILNISAGCQILLHKIFWLIGEIF